MKSIIPVVMAGIIAIYGLVVSVIIGVNIKVSCISAPVSLSVFLVSLLDSPSGSSEMLGSE